MFCNCLLIPLFLSSFLSASVHLIPPPLGVHPLDEKYYAAEIIKCKDGSNSFTRDRLNDDYCDCVDGTDEPGTSACPAGKFYCRNKGSSPLFIFSSHVNDGFCDCCDGSDEYDSGIKCPNMCVMGGNIEYKTETYISASNVHSAGANERKDGIHLDDLIEKLKGLKMIAILEVVLIGFLVIWRIFRRHLRSKRRRHH
ncbi:hypothetical protein SLEP1_g15167 [Rubroshorea leprosula]|uniref:Glucosidase II beta subunit N-terminal domain-containing protein n=2 Tax=Rubroshorea leprosula TaxID=152421 RepID=A0AAV5IVD8_9ROSI|nr:hypothetical protein SLEP1_g15167 [Rubroshorea leprosula]